MVPDKFNMVDMGGIDLIMMQGEAVPGLYDKLMTAISNCRYQCLYNWIFDGVLIPPTYVQLTDIDGEVYLNEGVSVTSDDVIHIHPAEPKIIPLLAEENGVYNVPDDKDGFNPVTVDVPSYTPVIESLSVTQNGAYSAPTGIDGYSPVVVNVPSEAPAYAGNNREYLFRVSFSGISGWIHVARNGDVVYGNTLTTPITGEFITVESDGRVVASSACAAKICTDSAMGSETLYAAGDNFPAITGYLQVIIAWEPNTSVEGDHELTFSWGKSSDRSYQRVIIKSDGTFIPHSGQSVGDVFKWVGLDSAYLTTDSLYTGMVRFCCANNVVDMSFVSGVLYEWCSYGLYFAVSYTIQ